MPQVLAENILLSGSTAKALIKCALQEGFIDLIKPKTKSEVEQIKSFTKIVNRSRSTHTALHLALLAETIYLDELSIGSFTIFEDLDAEDNWQNSRDIIKKASSSFSETLAFVEPVSAWYVPSLNAKQEDSFLSQGLDSDQIDLASACNMLEPLISARGQNTEALKKIERPQFRKLFDEVLINEDFREAFFNPDKYGDEKLDALCLIEKTFPENDTLEYLRFMSLMRHHSIMVLQKVREAERISAKLPLAGWLDKNVKFNRRDVDFLDGISDDAVASMKLILREFRYFPAITSLSDLLSVREHPDFRRFKSFLDMWTRAISDGNTEDEKRLRAELELANHSLDKSVKCKEIGGYITYVGLPMIALDTMIGPFFGTPTTIGGFGLQAYADWKNKKNKWVLVGRR